MSTSGAAGRSILPSRARFAAWSLLWGVVIVYSSVVINPDGPHFARLAAADAWALFLKTPYVVHGSDQRSDWMGNLMFLVPFGFLVTGTAWPWRRPWWRWPVTGAVLLACLLFILAVKYAQLYAPPRTVTLNYIFAQTLGAALGIALFWVFQRHAVRLLTLFVAGRQHTATILLAAYSAGVFLFALFPFDFVLSAGDFHDRLASLPQWVFALPGAGRSAGIRFVLVLGETTMVVPFGVFLALQMPDRTVRRISVQGFFAMAGLSVATMFVMSATPYLVAIAYRTFGIAAGAALVRAMRPEHIARAKRVLHQSVPWLILPYVAGILFINQLLTTHWQSFDAAVAAFDWRGLWPFWHHYIVSKSQAIQSIVVHGVTYAPIGAMVWLRRRGRAPAKWLSIFLAAGLALLVEAARGFRPDLQPDFSDAIVAGIAAWLAFNVMPWIWGGPQRQSTGAALDHADDTAPLFPAAQPLARAREEASAGLSFAACARLVAMGCIAADLLLIARYPLFPWALGGVVAAYGAALWRWPAAWLALLPGAAVAVNLAPWTGWLLVGESDLFVLATIAVLLVRRPRACAEFRLDRTGLWVLGFYAACWAVSFVRGEALDIGAAGGANLYLAPENALRMGKGFIEALLLLPWLVQAFRDDRPDEQRLGAGMILALVAVAVIVLIERLSVTGLFDVTSDYRVAGPFASMHIGGGFIGTFMAMAFPFCVGALAGRTPYRTALALPLVLYALVVTFARTAYGAAIVGSVIAVIITIIAARRRRVPTRGLILACVAAGAMIAALGLVSETGFMRSRLEAMSPDLGTRENNWRGGMSERPDGISSALFGSGLGTFPRIHKADAPPQEKAVDFALRQDAEGIYLTLGSGSALYFGQKIAALARVPYRLEFEYRFPRAEGQISAMLCRKYLAYSEDCGTTTFGAAGAGWTKAHATLKIMPSQEDGGALLPQPTDLSFTDSIIGTSVDIRNVRLLAPDGTDLIANGSFTHSLDRWFFTSDAHWIWRMFNTLLMTLFEQGWLGLVGLLLLGGLAFYRALVAGLAGSATAAAIAGSIGAFSVSSQFDSLLEEPRLSVLFYIICFAGVLLKSKPLSSLTILAPGSPLDSIILRSE